MKHFILAFVIMLFMAVPCFSQTIIVRRMGPLERLFCPRYVVVPQVQYVPRPILVREYIPRYRVIVPVPPRVYYVRPAYRYYYR